jgi:hypothetical protein
MYSSAARTHQPTYLVREQQTDRLETLSATIYIVTEKQVVDCRWKSAAIEQTQEIDKQCRRVRLWRGVETTSNTINSRRRCTRLRDCPCVSPQMRMGAPISSSGGCCMDTSRAAKHSVSISDSATRAVSDWPKHAFAGSHART